VKYRIIQEIDGLGNSVFYAQYEVQSRFGKPKWMYEENIGRTGYLGPQRFETAASALRELKRYRAPKKINIVDEGEL